MTLSPAQLQERRDAARARWDKARQAAAIAAGAAAGGAAGGALATRGAGILRERLVARARPALAPMLDVATRHNARDLKIRSAFAGLRSKLSSETSFPATAASLFDMMAARGERTQAAVDRHKTANSETFFDSTSGESVEATLDLPGQRALQDKAQAENAPDAGRFRATAVDLREKGRSKQVRQRAGSVSKPKVETFTRKTRGAPVLSMSARAKSTLEHTLSYDAEQREKGGNELSLLHDLGLRSIDDVNQWILNAPKEHRKNMIRMLTNEVGVPGITIKRKKTSSTVRNTSKTIKAHKITIASYPTPEVRTKMRRELIFSLKSKERDARERVAERKAAELAPLRPMAAAAGRSLRWLRPGAAGRRGLVGAGIVGGTLAGAFLANRIERKYSDLAKSDDDKSKKRKPPINKMLLGAAESVEAPLAAGVAKAFNAWKAAATPEALQEPESANGLLDKMVAQLYAGMAPLDGATEDGLAAPSRIMPSEPNDSFTPRTISFTFGLRSTYKDDFIKNYRLERVREFTDEQRSMLQTALASQALTGVGPDVLARQIRSSIGLTQHQAALVQNYRAQLETLDARALNRSLRDGRFDSTIENAIKQDTPLTEAQVDKAVDAYHRRFLAYRAMTIARTESLRAANNAHIEEVRQFLGDNPDFTVVKTWIATDDEHTRPDHVALNRTSVVGLDTPFQCDDGSTIKWPHDPDGTAAQTIQCRCTPGLVIVARPAAERNGADYYSQPYDTFWQSIVGSPIQGDLETA